MTYDSISEVRGPIYADFIQEHAQFKGHHTSYARSGFLTAAFVRSFIIEFEGEEAAHEFIERQIELNEGAPDILQYAPMSFEELGQQSAAFRGIGRNTSGSEYELGDVLIRYHNLVGGIVYTGYLEISELVQYARILDQRLRLAPSGR